MIMEAMTKDLLMQKMQQLKQLADEVEALSKELVEAGAIEIPQETLDEVSGGFTQEDIRRKHEKQKKEEEEMLKRIVEAYPTITKITGGLLKK